MYNLTPVPPAIKKLILKAVQDEPGKSYEQIAKDWGVGERTVRKFAKQAGIARKPGIKPWRVRVPPSLWTAAQRRIAFQAAKIEEGLAAEAAELKEGL